MKFEIFSTVLINFILFLFLTLVSAEDCPVCGSLVEGDAYYDGMVKGIATITMQPGSPCTQYITCSRLDDSPDGLAQISITVDEFGAPQPVEYGTDVATLTLECSENGQYLIPEFPEFPLRNIIQCESTPAAPTTTTTTTTTTSTTTTTTTPPCPEGGTWSAWSAPACNDTCGLCGVKVQTRTCTSEASGCPCTGSAVQYGERCGDATCPFPRGSCCTAYAKRAQVGSQIKCVLL